MGPRWRAQPKMGLAAKRLARSAPSRLWTRWTDGPALAALRLVRQRPDAVPPLLASAGFALTLYRALNAGLAVALDGEEARRRVEGSWTRASGTGSPCCSPPPRPPWKKLLAETVAAYVQAVR